MIIPESMSSKFKVMIWYNVSRMARDTEKIELSMSMFAVLML